MFAYSIESNTPVQDTIFWSQQALAAVAPGLLTPFSFSVLAEIARRSWYNYYDRLGFEPRPGRHLLRQHNGRAYLNLSISAQIEAERAGVEPLAFWLNDQLTPLAVKPKSGLLAAFKTGRNQKRISTLLNELATELTQIEQRARTWHAKTQELRWSQAEILQVMEEIERVGADSLMTFLAARHNIMLLYNRAYQLLRAESHNAASWEQTKTALGRADTLHELDIARQIAEMGGALRSAPTTEPALATMAQTATWAEWRLALPEGALKSALTTFFTQYGQRCALEGELALPRWLEAPASVIEALQAAATGDAATFQAVDAQPLPSLLQNQLAAGAQKQLAQWQQEAAALHALQSRALHAFSYIQAGTRTWALAAAKEAMSDGRLTSPEDVFYFDLEEIKQMMTGEWNISSTAEIHATTAERKAQYQAWRDAASSPLLVGNAAAMSVHTLASAPDMPSVISLNPTRTIPAPAIIDPPRFIHVEQLSTGDAIFLQVANGFIVDTETALDPIVVAAQHYGRQIFNAPSVHRNGVGGPDVGLN
ncbi:MAG: hypothetical protein H6641_01035 [Caldilineaceae bacterium]|nr:hypothetical protein [Caldilineaceae bacterium]